jgi:hypothetical protein
MILYLRHESSIQGQPNSHIEEELPEVTSPEATLTGNDGTGSHATGTGSHVTRSDREVMF